ncbi:MAG: ATP-binding protein [Alphaproteobacteria bacterium]
MDVGTVTVMPQNMGRNAEPLHGRAGSHAEALARASEIGLDGVRRLDDVAEICLEMLQVLEDAEPDMRISVMAVDRDSAVLRLIAAPRLPKDYLAAVDGIPFGPGIGSCGAAAAEGGRVIVADIFDHPNWAPYQALARMSGMRACWSLPIFGAGEEVIGTFAVYHPHPCEPTEAQAELVEASARIFGVVLAYTQAHRKLQTALKRLEFATEAGGIGIWDWEEATDRLTWDDRMLALYGIPRDQFSGSIDDFRSRVDPDDLLWLERDGIRALRSGQLFKCEFTIIRASDGSRRRIAEHCAPQVDPRTGQLHLIGIDWDVTEQREREEQLRQAQKMEAVGQLTGGVAHDLNNLLTVILGNLELIEERQPEDPRLRASVAAAIKASTRGAKLIDQLLSFSRRAVLMPESLDIGRSVSGLEEMLRRSLPETIQIDIALAEEVWRARLDRNQFENALLNLALNARDAMPEGGRLLIETDNVELDADEAAEHGFDTRPGPYVMVAVTDTGEGMTPEVVSHAFEPFFTTKGVGKGTGLGLSMIYGFVKQSGGSAQIESRPGAGTTVRLYFPGDLPAEAAEEATSRSEIPRARPGERVLVVEDEATVRDVVVAQLKMLGYQVGAASNGAEATAVLESDPGFDLLLTDLVMPAGVSGWTLGDRARALHPAIKVVYMSGYRAGADGRPPEPGDLLLMKPINRTRLATALRRALDGG